MSLILHYSRSLPLQPRSCSASVFEVTRGDFVRRLCRRRDGSSMFAGVGSSMFYYPRVPSRLQLLAGARLFVFRNNLLPFQIPLSLRDAEFDTNLFCLLWAGERKVLKQSVDHVKISLGE